MFQNTAAVATATYTLCLYFKSGNGGSMFLQNIREFLPDCNIPEDCTILLMVITMRTSNPTTKLISYNI
jgi:hypothetical protein